MDQANKAWEKNTQGFGMGGLNDVDESASLAYYGIAGNNLYALRGIVEHLVFFSNYRF